MSTDEVQASKLMQQMVATSDYSLKWWDKVNGYKVEEIFHGYDDMISRLSEIVRQNGDLQVTEFKVGNRRATLMWHERQELP